MKAATVCTSTILCLLFGLCVASCDSFTNPCRRVSKAPGGPSKEQYLPCASALLDSLGKVDAGLMKLSDGRASGRGEALHAMGEFERDARLMGGRDRLQEKWNDRELNEINGHIYDAYRIYKMETNGLVIRAAQWMKLGDTSTHNVELARREAERARSLCLLAK